MTPEKCLNQIEPFIAELSAQLDRVAAQNKQLITIAVQHTDDIQFLLREVGDLKLGQVKLEQSVSSLEQGVATLERGQAKLELSVGTLERSVVKLEQSVGTLEEGQVGLTNKVDGITGKVDGLSGKVDLILELLQSGNGPRNQ